MSSLASDPYDSDDESSDNDGAGDDSGMNHAQPSQESTVLRDRTNTETLSVNGGDEAVTVSKKMKLARGPTSTKKHSKVASKEKSSLDAADVVNSLSETNKLLQQMYRRMDKYEERMRRIEDKIDGQSSCPSSSGSTPARKRSKEVPLEVRVGLLKTSTCTCIYM